MTEIKNQGSDVAGEATPFVSGRSDFPAGQYIELPIAGRLGNAESLQDIFGLVKEVVWKALKADQAGLMVGLAEMGVGPNGVLGAFYSPEANTIIINKTVMDKVSQLPDRRLYNSYCFYILLHEYLHSCGFYDEMENRQIVAAIAANEFGLDHAVTRLATANGAMAALLKKSFSLGGGNVGSQAAITESGIDFVQGIDRSNTNYIS